MRRFLLDLLLIFVACLAWAFLSDETQELLAPRCRHCWWCW